MIKEYELKNLDDTKLLAKTISKIAEKNIYLLLNGELASGKTQLTKFIGETLKIKETITSPTFMILNQYNTSYDWKLVHIDAYRLNQKSDFSQYFELTINNFTVIEWATNLNWNFDKNKRILISFENENKRKITISTYNLTKQQEEILFSSLAKLSS